MSPAVTSGPVPFRTRPVSFAPTEPEARSLHRSPVTGRVLAADSPHSLVAPGERWPVIDGIAYLRTGSEALAAEALARLDAGDADAATALLLAENDPWWDEAPPPHRQLLELVRSRDDLTLREVMDGLGWGRVGTYFAHRWSDPTFLAGLVLLDRHWCAPDSAFELACGIGHELRALGDAGVKRLAGGDVVFGKLWVCRHWVCPEAELTCFDAEASWPVSAAADLVTCPDAFYFLDHKAEVAASLRAAARLLYAVPHVHNVAAENHSAGAATSIDALRGFFPGATIYDDAELTRAGAAGRRPHRSAPSDAEAFSVVGGPSLGRSLASALLRPKDGTTLRRNPLLSARGIAWPSGRYEEEYGSLATYGRSGPVPERAAMSDEVAPLVRSRDLLDLPARW